MIVYSNCINVGYVIKFLITTNITIKIEKIKRNIDKYKNYSSASKFSINIKITKLIMLKKTANSNILVNSA